VNAPDGKRCSSERIETQSMNAVRADEVGKDIKTKLTAVHLQLPVVYFAVHGAWISE